MAFVKANRQKVFIKLALTGPSGSGKTFSALALARGMAGPQGKIAVLDTENGSASLYADKADFDTQVIEAPFTVKKYLEAIQEAVGAGYDVLIIDSLSHAWAGEGGLLSQKEAADARGGNQFTNWAPITKQQEVFKAGILQAPIHVIATMRSKQEYVIDQNGSGKSAPKKVGTAPVQREGMEYEFSTVFDISINHEAFVSKDRTGLFEDVVGLLKPEHGKRIRQWLESGATPAPEPSQTQPQPPRHQSPQGPTAKDEETQPRPLVSLNGEKRRFFDGAVTLRLDVTQAGDTTKPDAKKAMQLFKQVTKFLKLDLDPDLPADWRTVHDNLPAYAEHLRTDQEKAKAAEATQQDPFGDDPFAEDAPAGNAIASGL